MNAFSNAILLEILKALIEVHTIATPSLSYARYSFAVLRNLNVRPDEI
jgi:hypothetical protein